MEAKVYYTSLKLRQNENLLDKLERLVKRAGIENIDFKDKFTAIKIHFGEPGNLAYLRPNYARRIVQVIKELGGKVFLTDCNTLYVGRRKNGLDHLEAAYENGYNPFQTGCQIVIADGIKGLDQAEVAVNLEYIEKAKIGRALYDSDIIISMNHFKGHDLAGFGGALKNLGMGGASRAGKAEIHSSGKPQVNEDLCRECRACLKECAQEAIFLNPKAKIDHELCVGCGRCISACGYDAIEVDWQESSANMNKKVAEYTFAILENKKHFHISFVIDVSPACDCEQKNDLPIISDVGFLASFDPVALDQACVDLVNLQPLNAPYQNVGADHFKSLHPHSFGEIGLEHAEKIGIGRRKYRFVEI